MRARGPFRLEFASAAAVLLGLGAGPSYPPAPRADVTDDYHGTSVPDPYRPLETLDDARTLAWLRAERKLTTDTLARLPGRDAIRRRLEALWDVARTEVPWREGGRLFFLRNAGRDPQPVLFVQDGAGAPRALLDPRALSRDGSIAVGEHAVSPGGRLLAYRTARGGGDLGEIHVRDIASGRDTPDVVRGVLSAVCWTRDGRGFLYVRPSSDEAGGTAARAGKQVRYHLLGEPQARDRLVHDWPRGARWVYCMASEDGRWALLVAEHGLENELWLLRLGDARRPDPGVRPVRLVPGSAALFTPVDFAGDTLYVRTNLGAPRARVVSLDLTRGAEARPREVVPQGADVLVDAVIAGDLLVLHALADVKSRVHLHTLDGAPAGEIALPGIGSVGWPIYGRAGDPELFFSFESFLQPSTVYRFDVKSRRSVPFLPPRVPFEARAYETRQVFFASKDGTRVPMFVTGAKSREGAGSHPALLTGYGGYGASLSPRYDPALPLWLERGGVYAVASIRGGGEYGEEWHRAGMLGRKQNSFDDFIAAAEHLIAERITTAGRLGIYGHSNGGLLVGAVLTQRPELFGAAVANAGHYDMLRYAKFTVGAGWISEYGDPADPEAFAALRAYSPLHNVRPGVCYPATLLLAADHDDRVVPSHAYKFAAALQARQACASPILLRVAANASHGYASRGAEIAEKADMWTFLAARLGR